MGWSSPPSAGRRSAPPDYFPEWDEVGVRQYHDYPVVVHACGPRIIENFLDMAHFPFVHAGILGRSRTPRSATTR